QQALWRHVAVDLWRRGRRARRRASGAILSIQARQATARPHSANLAVRNRPLPVMLQLRGFQGFFCPCGLASALFQTQLLRQGRAPDRRRGTSGADNGFWTVIRPWRPRGFERQWAWGSPPPPPSPSGLARREPGQPFFLRADARVSWW